MVPRQKPSVLAAWALALLAGCLGPDEPPPPGIDAPPAEAQEGLRHGPGPQAADAVRLTPERVAELRRLQGESELELPEEAPQGAYRPAGERAGGATGEAPPPAEGHAGEGEGGIQAPRAGAGAEREEGASEIHAPGAGADHAAQEGREAQRTNRDRHGPDDVERYIARLESPERIAEMRPDFVIETLGPAPSAIVADIGCGPGVFSLRFGRACPHGFVLAVDIEPRQLDRLREHLLEEGIENVVPVLASPTDPHLPPGRIDWIFIGDTYHHLQERVEYMRRLKRLLAPGGRLAVFEYKPGDLPVGPPADHKLQEGELEAELTLAGYEQIADHDTHEYHQFQVWRPAEER